MVEKYLGYHSECEGGLVEFRDDYKASLSCVAERIF